MSLSPHQAIRQRLVSWPGLADIVGSSVYFQAAATGASYPYVIMHHIDDIPYRHINGPSGLSVIRLQVDAYAESADVAWSVSDQVRLALDGWNGTVTIAGDSLRISQVVRDSMEAPALNVEFDSSSPIRRFTADYRVTYQEQIIPRG